MLVNVAERNREVGIRKAIGATNGNIINQFLDQYSFTHTSTTKQTNFVVITDSVSTHPYPFRKLFNVHKKPQRLYGSILSSG